MSGIGGHVNRGDRARRRAGDVVTFELVADDGAWQTALQCAYRRLLDGEMARLDLTAVVGGLSLTWQLPATAGVYARELDSAQSLGLMLGLSADETRETVSAWLDHYAARPDPTSWARVRLALAERATGKLWHPDDELRAWLQRTMPAPVDFRGRGA